MSIRTALALISSLVFVACGGGNKPAENAEPAGSASAAPAASDTPPAEEKSSDKAGGDTGGDKPAEAKAEPATAPKIDKPAADGTIGGKSVSEVDGAGLGAELKKLGWAKDGAAGSSAVKGSYEEISIDIEKGKAKGKVLIVRPAMTPGEASGAGTAPKDQADAKDKEGAAHYDEASDVLVAVSIEGKAADAKKLLGQLVKMAKKAAPKAEPKATPKAEPKATPKATPKKK